MAEMERFDFSAVGIVGDLDAGFFAASDGRYIRYSDHLSDKAEELEELAGEFSGEVEQIEADNPDAPERSVGRAIALGQAATRLRERAAELRGGTDAGA